LEHDCCEQKTVNRPIIFITALFGFLALFAFVPGVHAVSEEDLGATTTRPTYQNEAPPAPSEAAPAPAEDVNPAPRTPPHANFPYTIRTGDTLGSIAGLFGIPVTELARINHLSEDTELVAGHLLKIPNPAIFREREMTSEIAQLTQDKELAQTRVRDTEAKLQTARNRVAELTEENRESTHDLRTLGWWRATAWAAGAAALLLFGAMMLAIVEWWVLRSRFRAVAEMNDALRRLDYKYRTAFAKAELRLQELYGRRRRGIHDGQERPKIAEETEIEILNRELKAILEQHLERLGPAGSRSRRALWRERLSGIGSPVEARPARR
jgi:LysM repeat protein